MHHMIKFELLLLLVVVISGCESSSAGMSHVRANDEIVTVFAAASTTNAMDEVKEAFTRTTGVSVRTNYAASSTLAQQIVNGADADLFLSANADWADHVESKTTSAKRRNLLGNRLVIVVPSDSQLALPTPEALLSKEVDHLALGDTDSVPAGKYARQALVALNLWDKLKGKIVPGKDVRQALMYVETGAAEAGIVYATDAAVSERVRVAIEIPADLTEPVVYPVMLLKHGTDRGAAAKFYDYLGSPEATRIFERCGFVGLADAGNPTK